MDKMDKQYERQNEQRVLEGKNRGDGKQTIFNENYWNLGSIVSSKQDTYTYIYIWIH